MTTPADLLTYIDRPGYERACVAAGTTPLPDSETARLAETGYERLADPASAGAPATEKVALATHLRRGWSLHTGRPETTPIGTPLLEGALDAAQAAAGVPDSSLTVVDRIREFAVSLAVSSPLAAQRLYGLSAALAETSVADKILDFAAGGRGQCTSGRAMARLYLLLTDRIAVPIRETDWGLDETRRAWWEAAMLEFSRGTWGGTPEGVERVRARHPYIARSVDAALAAYEKAERAMQAEAAADD